MKTNDTALDQIKCPNCGELFPVSEALSHQIAERTRVELQSETAGQQKIFAAKEKELAEREGALEKTVQDRLSSAQMKIAEEAEKRAAMRFLLSWKTSRGRGPKRTRR
jgi:hypothetical protein